MDFVGRLTPELIEPRRSLSVVRRAIRAVGLGAALCALASAHGQDAPFKALADRQALARRGTVKFKEVNDARPRPEAFDGVIAYDGKGSMKEARARPERRTRPLSFNRNPDSSDARGVLDAAHRVTVFAPELIALDLIFIAALKFRKLS